MPIQPVCPGQFPGADYSPGQRESNSVIEPTAESTSPHSETEEIASISTGVIAESAATDSRPRSESPLVLPPHNLHKAINPPPAPGSDLNTNG